MKKIFLSLAVLATMTMASCQPSATKAEDEGAAIKAKIENCQDPDSLKIYVQQAKDYAEKLQKEGDAEAAKAYLDEVTPVVTAKDPSMANIFDLLLNKADSTVNAAANSAADAVDSAKEAAKETANDAVNTVKDKANDAVNTAKEKTNEAVNTAKEKTNEAVNKGKEKAADAVQKGADKLKDVLK